MGAMENNLKMDRTRVCRVGESYLDPFMVAIINEKGVL